MPSRLIEPKGIAPIIHVALSHMTDPRAELFVAHPGHELLIHGWICRTRPAVHVLTDGSGHSRVSRISRTAELLGETGSQRGAIFGRLSDREAYAMILERNTTLLDSLVTELASELAGRRPGVIVCDAAEGYNPVHDLCRLIVGAAIEMAGVETRQYEYAVISDPRFPDATAEEITTLELDDAAYAAKMTAARREAAGLADIDELLSRHGAEVYRRETFRRVADWTDIGGDAQPLYERFGEERVAANWYMRVIRRAEHMIPLRDALIAGMEKRSCAF
jgi:hypothetical protein